MRFTDFCQTLYHKLYRKAKYGKLSSVFWLKIVNFNDIGNEIPLFGKNLKELFILIPTLIQK